MEELMNKAVEKEIEECKTKAWEHLRTINMSDKYRLILMGDDVGVFKIVGLLQQEDGSIARDSVFVLEEMIDVMKSYLDGIQQRYKDAGMDDEEEAYDE